MPSKKAELPTKVKKRYFATNSRSILNGPRERELITRAKAGKAAAPPREFNGKERSACD